MMQFYYGTKEVDNIKSNNWKKLHGIPLKAVPRTNYGGKLCFLNLNEYIPKRSRKKMRKFHLKQCFNPITEDFLQKNPELRQAFHRYGHMPKKMKKKLFRQFKQKQASHYK